ncbi:MAG: SCO family protein [Caulobacteraceae bacterium]
MVTLALWASALLLASFADRLAHRLRASRQSDQPGPGDARTGRRSGRAFYPGQPGRTAGRPVSAEGKWSVVFFGYTYCPDFCPTTITTLGKAMDQLGPKASDAQVIFITVDPERDNPAAMKSYISSRVFPKNILGLTGTPAQVAQVAKGYGVYYQKEGSGSTYTMDHSVALYLMDPSGAFHGVIPDGPPDLDAKQISDAMRGA